MPSPSSDGKVELERKPLARPGELMRFVVNDRQDKRLDVEEAADAAGFASRFDDPVPTAWLFDPKSRIEIVGKLSGSGHPIKTVGQPPAVGGNIDKTALDRVGKEDATLGSDESRDRIEKDSLHSTRETLHRFDPARRTSQFLRTIGKRSLEQGDRLVASRDVKLAGYTRDNDKIILKTG